MSDLSLVSGVKRCVVLIVEDELLLRMNAVAPTGPTAVTAAPPNGRNVRRYCVMAAAAIIRMGDRPAPSANAAVDITGQSARSPLRKNMADISQYSIVTYERRPGYWRAAITPIRRPSTFIQGKTISSIVTPDDFGSEPDARFAADKIIRKL
jgi:hypothetical protein